MNIDETQIRIKTILRSDMEEQVKFEKIDALFQQLKQENEELKKSLNYEEKMNVKIAEESVNVNDRLKAKLKKIKEICNRYKTCNVIHKDYILEIIEE